MSSCKMYGLSSVVIVFTFLVTPSVMTSQQEPTDAVAGVANANRQFALALYQNINARQDSKEQNIFVSPYSVSTALAMTYAGSRGNTQKQMASVLGFNGVADDELFAGFSSLLQQTKATPDKHYKLDVANALWGQKSYHFESTFTDAIGKYYDGGFNTVDYIGAREQSRKEINKWVEGKTADKITELIHASDLNVNTRLVLTNAIYFKGDWASRFDAKHTAIAPFTVTPNKIVNASMMEQNATFPFLETNELTMVELPYAGNDVSMVAILPTGSAEDFGAKLSTAKLRELRQRMRPRHVEVFLPRFKFETRYYLEQNLNAMGMPDAFEETKADFSGMTGKPNLYISHVIHQAMIDVNEEGSEAAAATAVVMTSKSIVIPATFRADRPFIFLIIHKPTDSILFIGRVSTPPTPVATAK